MNRRKFFKLMIGSAACVSLFRPRLWRFPEDATVDEINEFLFFRGLRPCPHSHHSTDEEFAECTDLPKEKVKDLSLKGPITVSFVETVRKAFQRVQR
jgi:hypothetical protein